MNRPYSRTHRYQNGLVGRTGIAASILVFVVLIILVLRFLAPGVLSMITQPIWQAGTYISSVVQSNVSLDSKSSLYADRERLMMENVILEAQKATLTAQVKDLTKLIGTRTEISTGILASVTARPPVAPYDVLIIDQGSTAGVTLGARVMGQGGTPIGTIGEVSKNQSRVALFSTHGIRTSGWAGEGRIPVTLVGIGAGAFTASTPKVSGVAVGDGVYLSGHGIVPIGSVVKLEENPSSPDVSIDIRPYINPFSITWVTVVNN